MKKRKRRTKNHRQHSWLAPMALAGIALLSLAVWATSRTTQASSTVKPDAAVDGGPDLALAKPDTVRILIQTSPPRRATVRWGRKRLGVIRPPRPLFVERPRDSGPMDLVIKASGYLTVRTRAYTFSDSRVIVKLTPPEEKSKLFGYREEPVPSIDGGVPPAPPPQGPPMPLPAPAPTAPAPTAPAPTAPAQ